MVIEARTNTEFPIHRKAIRKMQLLSLIYISLHRFYFPGSSQILIRGKVGMKVQKQKCARMINGRQARNRVYTSVRSYILDRITPSYKTTNSVNSIHPSHVLSILIGKT